MRRFRAGLGAVLGGAMLVGTAAWSAAPTQLDDPEMQVVPRTPGLDLDRRSEVTPVPVPHAGNPLWAVPLSALTVTRDRPLFSASRRPPPPAVVPPPPVVRVKAPPPPPPAEPEKPRLSLVGTVGGDEGIAVFLDQTTQAIVRLKTGEGHAGWVLVTVGGREVTLQNDHDTAILELPRPEGIK